MKKTYDRDQIDVGILGTGQLALMLAKAGLQNGLQIGILGRDPSNSPAGKSGALLFELDQSNAFFASARRICFESEFFDFSLVPKKAQAKCFPQIHLMKTLSDRLDQKNALQEHSLKTSPFIHSREPNKILDWSLGSGVVAKLRTGGYDGFGTFLLTDSKKLKQFLNNNEARLNDFIFERLIHFQRELAIVCGRSSNGETVFFPAVETIQKNAQLDTLKGPIEHAAFPRLKKKIAAFLKHLNYVGVMGIELFETDSKDLLINEIAPRVHNSGHYTQWGFSVDQFRLHLLCGLGASLSQPLRMENQPAFALANLIGSDKQRQLDTIEALGQNLTWYHKELQKDGRKMGHIEASGFSPELALRNVKKIRNRLWR